MTTYMNVMPLKEENLKMYQSISIAEAARIKQTSRQTIYNNGHKFNWTEDLKRIIPDKRFQDWQPKLTGGRRKL
jgi:hypothetical protein